MVLNSNARVLSSSRSVLERELSLAAVQASEALALLNRSTGVATTIEADDPQAMRALAVRFREQGAVAIVADYEHTSKLTVIATIVQYYEAAESLESTPQEIARCLVQAIEDFNSARGETLIGGRTFRWGSRTYVMGIVNTTPDSFSGDGLGYDLDGAVAQAERFIEEGADIVDVGGESTRPHAARVDTDEELRRVLPVVERLARELPVPVSVDTHKAVVAERCLDAGAALVNDIWGLQADSTMAALVAKYKVPVVIMHNQVGIEYRDLLGDVIGRLRRSMSLAREAGVPDENVIVDPGIGFGKSKEQNLELLHRLSELRVLGRPLLLGTSRKSTIGYVLSLPAEQRVEGTAATVALGIAQGADIVRVHDVQEMVRVARMADAIVRWSPDPEDSQVWPGQTG